jgi:uncharacterized BrkB/YihY/UPF0761 family membrane protein
VRLILFTSFFLITHICFASFPIENEILIEKIETKKLWYNTWWAIVLNIVFLIPSRSFILLNLIGFTGLFFRIYQNKNLWKLLLIIGAVVGTIGFIIFISYINKL